MRTSAGTRVAAGTVVGAVVGAVVSLWTIWEAAILIGWDISVATLLGWIWLALWRLSAGETQQNASREDPSIRLSEVLVLTAGVAVLAAVGLLLVRAGGATGGNKAINRAIKMDLAPWRLKNRSGHLILSAERWSQ